RREVGYRDGEYAKDTIQFPRGILNEGDELDRKKRYPEYDRSRKSARGKSDGKGEKHGGREGRMEEVEQARNRCDGSSASPSGFCPIAKKKNDGDEQRLSLAVKEEGEAKIVAWDLIIEIGEGEEVGGDWA
ncbi:523_t:CDS:2, partial [Acaulospora colombiana]